MGLVASSQSFGFQAIARAYKFQRPMFESLCLEATHSRGESSSENKLLEFQGEWMAQKTSPSDGAAWLEGVTELQRLQEFWDQKILRRSLRLHQPDSLEVQNLKLQVQELSLRLEASQNEVKKLQEYKAKRSRPGQMQREQARPDAEIADRRAVRGGRREKRQLVDSPTQRWQTLWQGVTEAEALAEAYYTAEVRQSLGRV